MTKQWFIKGSKIDPKQISEQYWINPILAKILSKRDFKNLSELETYINPTLDKLHNPKLLKDIEKGVQIIIDTFFNNKKIMIHSDYDVDGIISQYEMVKAFENCGMVHNVNFEYFIPDREVDGYGLNVQQVEEFHKKGISTIITVDNGVAAISAVERAKELGMNVVITDHHEPMRDKLGNMILPKADAIINPKTDNYPFKMLCGAGVVFKFVQVLYDTIQNITSDITELLPFVALATVCDVVDILDENKIFVKKGLEKFKETKNYGINALLKISKLEDKEEISVYDMGFILGPMINASSRMATPYIAFNLLQAPNEKIAYEKAFILNDLNVQRQQLTAEAVEKAKNTIQNSGLENDKILIMHDPDLKESIAGIVAGRIKETFYKPTVVLTNSNTPGIAKGSGRSIETYHMFNEFSPYKGNLLTKFGGHAMAAGMSLEIKNIENFRKVINNNCKLSSEDLTEKIRIDIPISLEDISLDLIDNINFLKPYGTNNPLPIFACKNVTVSSLKTMGKDNSHLSLNCSINENSFRTIRAVLFNEANTFNELVLNTLGEKTLNNLYSGKEHIKLDLVFYPDKNFFNNKTYIQLIIKDFRISKLKEGYSK